MGSNPTYSLWGGANLPHLPKTSETWKLAVKLGRVPKGGLNITLKPKNPNQSLVDDSGASWKYPALTALCRDLRRDT